MSSAETGKSATLDVAYVLAASDACGVPMQDLFGLGASESLGPRQ